MCDGIIGTVEWYSHSFLAVVCACEYAATIYAPEPLAQDIFKCKRVALLPLHRAELPETLAKYSTGQDLPLNDEADEDEDDAGDADADDDTGSDENEKLNGQQNELKTTDETKRGVETWMGHRRNSDNEDTKVAKTDGQIPSVSDDKELNLPTEVLTACATDIGVTGAMREINSKHEQGIAEQVYYRSGLRSLRDRADDCSSKRASSVYSRDLQATHIPTMLGKLVAGIEDLLSSGHFYYTRASSGMMDPF